MGVIIDQAYAEDTYLTEMFYKRDDGAIKEADKKYHALLFTVITAILKNDSDAEECLNDVYIKIWGSIPPNRPQSFIAYAIKIARNTAMSIKRAKVALKRVPQATVGLFEDVGDVTFDSERSETIRSIINDYLLSTDERRMYIFMSRYYFDKPISEIARKLHCSLSTVNKEIKKIKIELKEKLNEGGIYV